VLRPAPAPEALSDRVHPKLAALSSWVKQRKGELGLAVRDLGTGRELLSEGAEKSLNPASNQKLLTAAIALAELGPEFRFRVAVLGNIVDGVAERLVLRSDGDPTFTYSELGAFAQRLVELGLKRVSGDIWIDQSAFDDRYTPPAFEQQAGEWAAFRAPVSAVALDRNSTTLHVFPTEAGRAARVEFDPPGYVAVQGEVLTEKGKKRERIGLTMKPRGAQLGAEVSGSIPAGEQVFHITRRIDNPEIYAGVVLKRSLLSLGVAVQGDARRGGEDETRELVGRDSEKLSTLTSQLGKASDNFYAETLLKAVGAHSKGRPGTSQKGAEALADWLKAQRIFDAGLKVQNGSGLYDANRISSRALTQVLEAAYLDPKISRAYQEQLAVGGIDGTLRSRFYALRNRKSVHAKTGTLSRVVALSGYVFGPRQETGIAFSILVTGIAGQHGEARKRIDALVLEISDALWQPKSVAAIARR